MSGLMDFVVNCRKMEKLDGEKKRTKPRLVLPAKKEIVKYILPNVKGPELEDCKVRRSLANIQLKIPVLTSSQNVLDAYKRGVLPLAMEDIIMEDIVRAAEEAEKENQLALASDVKMVDMKEYENLLVVPPTFAQNLTSESLWAPKPMTIEVNASLFTPEGRVRKQIRKEWTPSVSSLFRCGVVE